jgi:ribosome-binding factor A
MVSKTRLHRIEDRIYEELSIILLMEVSDPRLAGVTVTKVRVDRELAYANIYVTSLEGSESADEVLAGLEHARGYLRSQLAQRVQLQHTPRLRFYWDPSPEHADRIEQLIASLHAEEEGKSDQGENNPVDK